MNRSPGPTSVGLLERTAELGQIDQLFHRLGARTGAAVVVEGPAGIGKSELLAAVRAGAQARGFGALAARGSEFEQEMAFGVARQLFEPMLRAASARERRRLLDGIARVGAGALGWNEGEPPVDGSAAVHGMFWLCANRADYGPLLLLVDDVQWADGPSLAWLGYLQRRVSDLAVGLVLGLRSDDPHRKQAELTALVRDGDIQRLPLAPLSPAAVGTIVRRRLDQAADELFCSACFDLTGGNPLYLRELLAAVEEEELPARASSVEALRRIAPGAVGVSVLSRLGRLGPEAIALAHAVAVLGPRTEVLLAARLGDLDPVAAEWAADRLAAAQILAPARPLEFFHPLFRAAILEDIAPGARRIAHRRAAVLVDGDLQGSRAQVAAHLLACAPTEDPWVVERLRNAALEALDRGAPEVAASYLRRALEEPPAAGERARLLFLLGSAMWRAGQSGAISHFERALAGAGDDTGTLAAATTLLTRAYIVSDRVTNAVTLLERTLGAVDGRDSTVALTIEATIATAGMLDERAAADALKRCEDLYRRLDSLTAPSVELLVLLSHYAARIGRAAEAGELADRALACEPYPPPLDNCNVLITTLTFIERYETLQRLCQDLLVAARKRAAMDEVVGILSARAWALCDCGALAEAEADTRWVLECGQGIHRMHAIGDLIRVLIERDRLDQAEDALTQIEDPQASYAAEVSRLLLSRGRLRAAQGRLQEALSDFLESGRRCRRLGVFSLPAMPWRSEAAIVHTALGNTREAQSLASDQLELARAFGRPRTLGISLRAAGLTARGEAGLELLAEAVKILDDSRSPLELARALADYGAALRRSGHRIRARGVLERALDLAHHLGAHRIAKQARSELITAGARPRREAITGRDALTAGELRVARLAAQGLSNRDIAQALFITTATAKAHLNRVYSKLEVSRRGQLTDALAEDVHTAALASPLAGPGFRTTP